MISVIIAFDPVAYVLLGGIFGWLISHEKRLIRLELRGLKHA